MKFLSITALVLRTMLFQNKVYLNGVVRLSFLILLLTHCTIPTGVNETLSKRTQENKQERLVLADSLPGTVPRPTDPLKYECGQSFFLPDKRFLVFKPKNTNESCLLNFFGSRVEKCRVTIHCAGIGTTHNSISGKCPKGYFSISDAMGGRKSGCGKNMSTKSASRPSKFGHDLYIKFKGMKETGQCEIFCGEDQSSYEGLGNIGSRELPKDSNDQRKMADCVCGMRGVKDQQGRIVGGKNAEPFEFPWMAGLVMNKDVYVNKDPVFKKKLTNRNPICGGSLITDSHILTAAHCFPGKSNPKNIQVLLHAHLMDVYIWGEPNSQEIKEILDDIPGGHEKKVVDKDEKSVRFEVEKIVTHPLYMRGGQYDYTFDFDVAIIFLKGKVDFKKHKAVRPVCLYSEDKKQSAVTYAKDELLEVIGWGVVKEGGKGNSRILQKMKVPPVKYKNCKKFMPDVPPRHVCAAFLRGEIDACQGDSGSPAIMPLKGNQYQQIGIVSSGIGCAREKTPGLYTDTFEVLEWIYHQTRKGRWCKTS